MASPVETIQAFAEVDRRIATLTISLNQLTVIQIPYYTASMVRLFSMGIRINRVSFEQKIKQIEIYLIENKRCFTDSAHQVYSNIRATESFFLLLLFSLCPYKPLDPAFVSL